MKRRLIPILIADDDEDDRLLVQRSFAKARVTNPLYFVTDGIELLDYLHRRGKYADPATSPRPGLVLLDLNMPRKDGRQALSEIKEDPSLRAIPVIVLTTSGAEEDVFESYRHYANSFIRKPVTVNKMVEIMERINHYWIEIVELPRGAGESDDTRSH